MSANTVKRKIPLIVLIGPTAVGKSSIALKVSRMIKTDIISADSAQVYRRLDIGTAKPTSEEKKMVKHHLIDIINPDQFYSVADYQNDADQVICNVWKENKLPFMVGGTGLYVKAVTDRYAFGPQGASRELRANLEESARSDGLDKLYSRLKSIDPEAAKNIHPNDLKRIIRALEVYSIEGRPISEQVTRSRSRESPYKTLIFGLNMDRKFLYRRIEERVDKMIEKGFLDEVKKLHEEGLDEHTPGMQVLGYKQLMEYLKNQKNLDDTINEVKKQTRNLAKRQMTWFRREKTIEWISISKEILLDNIAENIYNKVKELAL